MARRRKQPSEEMRDLAQKINGMASIDENFDAGNGVTIVAARALLAEGEGSLADYNQTIAQTDEKDNIFKAKNKQIRAFNKKVLPAVGLTFGMDSSEYEQVGGVRESERKKPVRKPKSPNP